MKAISRKHLYILLGVIISLVFVVCLIIVLNKNVKVSKNQTGNKVKLNYEITIDNFKDGEAKVRIHISNLSSPYIDMRELSHIGYKNELNSFKVYNKFRKELSTKKIEGIRDIGRTVAPQWKIDLSSNKNITIEYTKNIKYVDKNQNGKKYWGYIGDDFACFSGEQLLLVPTDSSVVDPDISVKFIVPKGNSILVPWYRDGDYYYPNKNQNIEKFNHIGESLNFSTILIGKFAVHNFTSGSTNVVIGLPVDVDETIVLNTVKDIETTFKYYSDLFGEDIDNTYQIAFYKLPSSGIEINNFEWTNGQTIPLRGREINVNKLGHQIFHRWNAFWYKWRDNDLGYLLREGIVRYYENKSTIILCDKLNEIDSKTISDLYNNYKTYRSLPETERKVYKEAENSLYRYDIGALFCLYLDNDIIKSTDNKKSLDDLIKIFWNEYGKKAKVINRDVFIAELQKLTGKDYSEFYDFYISGNKTLNMDKIFSDTDKDGVLNYMETIKGTNENDNKSYNEVLKNKLQTINYPNGDIYIGEIENDMPNGNGKLLFSNGVVYDGEWTKGKKNGHGKLIYPNGKIDEGTWVDDKFQKN